jgi:putative ABC transport system permease protein
MLVGAASLQTSANAEIAGNYPVDFQVRSSAQPPNPNAVATLPVDLAGRLDRTGKFQRPVEIREYNVEAIKAPGGTLGLNVVGAEPADLRAHVPSAAALDGRLGDFGPGTLVLTKSAADQLGKVRAGQTVTVPGPATSRPLRVAAVIKGGFEAPFGGVTISATDFTALFGTGQPTGILLWKHAGVDAATARDALDATIVKLPDASVDDLAEYRAQISSDINQLLEAGGLLVAMAMVIAVLGVMTTLTLSVFERRREIALLRALGLTRGQLYATLTLEGAIMAVLAAVIGVALGIGLGIAGTLAVFGDSDNLLIDVPGGRIALVLLVAAIIGMLAALPPARRASRTAPVAALAAA